MLGADDSPRQVERGIVIRLELKAKVGHQDRFSTEPGNRGYTTRPARSLSDAYTRSCICRRYLRHRPLQDHRDNLGQSL